MNNNKTAVSLLAIALLAACAPEPLSRDQLFTGVTHYYGAEKCIQKGYIQNMGVVSAYLQVVGARLGRQATEEQRGLAIQELERMNQWPPQITRENCRILESKAYQYSQGEEERRRQQEAFSQAMDNMPTYTPRYTNCYTGAVATNCVTY